jgi:hypothetical protein
LQKKEKKKEKGERSKEGEATNGDGDTDDVVATMDNLNIEDALALGNTAQDKTQAPPHAVPSLCCDRKAVTARL